MQCPTCDGWFTGTTCDCGYLLPKRGGGATVRSTEHEIHDGISADEFGQGLYHALVLVGGILQLRRFRELVAMGYAPKTTEFDRREAALKDELRESLRTITADEVRGLLTNYPWVEACLPKAVGA